MKRDLDKRVLLVVMAACLAGLVFLCADGRTIIRWTAEVANPRQNESLFLEWRENDVLYVGGEGKLFGTDMQAMVAGESLVIADVQNVIVGDGIIEVGFDAFSKYEGMKTLWLGKNVTIAGNGSVRECKSLEYVFLPEGLKRAGKDFLYDCNSCRVITDGPADSLPKMKNVKKAQLLTDIDSFDALAEACGPDQELPDALKQWWP